MSEATVQLETQESLDSSDQNQTSEASFTESLWNTDESGEVVANTVDVSGKTEQLLSDPDWTGELLAEYGLDDADPSTINYTNLELAEGQSGTWDPEAGTYTPSWDIAFSDQDVYFILTFDVTDPLDSGYTLRALSKEILLQFERSGLDLEQLVNDPASTDPITVDSDNGVGILLAYGADRQAARGIPDEKIKVELSKSELGTQFFPEQLKSILEVDGSSEFGSAGNDPPKLRLISTNSFTQNAPENAVGSIVAVFSVSDFDNDQIVVNISDEENYTLGIGPDFGKVLLTEQGLNLVNSGEDLPIFELTPTDGTTDGTVVSVSPDVKIDEIEPTAQLVFTGPTQLNTKQKRAAFTITFSERVQELDDLNLIVTGGKIIELVQSSGSQTEWNGIFEADSDLEGIARIRLPAQGYKDLSGNGGQEASATILVDTRRPAGAAPTIRSITTNSTNPVLSGTADLEDGDELEVEVELQNESKIFTLNNGIILDGASQTWALSLKDLSESTYTISAVIKDAAGNESDRSEEATLTILRTPPPEAKITSIENRNGFTVELPQPENETTEQYQSIIRIRQDGVILTDAAVRQKFDIISTSNNREYRPKALKFDGESITVEVIVRDQAGNTTSKTSEPIQLDTTPPSPPTVGNLYTSGSTQTVRGTAVLREGEWLDIKIVNAAGDRVFGSQDIDVDQRTNTWSLDVTLAEEGDYKVIAKVTDPANRFAESSPAELIFRKAAPTAPVFISVTSTGDDINKEDFVTNVSNPKITGTLISGDWEEAKSFIIELTQGATKKTFEFHKETDNYDPDNQVLLVYKDLGNEVYEWTLDLDKDREDPDLAGTWNISATIVKKDGLKASSYQTLQIDTQATGVLVLNPLAGDNILKLDELLSDNLPLTGSVDGEARQGDTVTIFLNGNSFTATVEYDKSFTVDLPVIDLLEDRDTTIVAQIEVKDDAGNKAIVIEQFTYSLDQAPNQPQLGSGSIWIYDETDSEKSKNGLEVILNSIDPDNTPGGLTYFLIDEDAGGNDNKLVDLHKGNRLKFKETIDHNELANISELRFDVGVRETISSQNEVRSTARVIISKTNVSNKTPSLSDEWDGDDDGVLRFTFATPVLEGDKAINIAGQRISSFNQTENDKKPFGFYDGDSVDGEISGYAIVGNTAVATQGRWQVRGETNGSTWLDIPFTISDSAPFLIRRNDVLRFLPVEGFLGEPKLKIRALDSGAITLLGTQEIVRGTLPSGVRLPMGGGEFGVGSNELIELTQRVEPRPKPPSSLTLAEGAFINIDEGVVKINAQLTATDDDSGFLFALEDENGAVENQNDYVDIDPLTGQVTLLSLDKEEKDNFINTVTEQGYLALYVRVSDFTTAPLKRLIGIPISSANNAPQAAETTAILPAWQQGSNAESDRTIDDLFGSLFVDDNPNDRLGVAVVDDASTANPLNGRWQYRLENGETFLNIPTTVSDSSPLILGSGDKLRFLPSAGFSGTPGPLSVRLLDTSRTRSDLTGSNNGTTLKTGVPLVIGGSGNTSQDVVQLSTRILAAAQKPGGISLSSDSALTIKNNEPESKIGSVIGIDPDTDNSQLRYRIVNDTQLLTIDELTGELTAKAPSETDGYKNELDQAIKNGFIEFIVAIDDREDDNQSQRGGESFKTLILPIKSSENTAPIIKKGYTASIDNGETWVRTDPRFTNAQLAKTVILGKIDQNSKHPDGDSIKTLFGEAFYDQDDPSFLGVAVTNNGNVANALSGRWQYSLDDGITFFNIPTTVSDSSPLILGSGDKVRFLPSAGFSGTPGPLSVRLLDTSRTRSDLTGSDNGTTLKTGVPLVIGASGNASTATLALFTHVSKVPQKPTGIFLAPQKLTLNNEETLIASQDSPVLLALLAGVDPDSKPSDLSYSVKFLDQNGDEQQIPGIYVENNRILTNKSLTSGELLSLKFTATVTDETGLRFASNSSEPYKIEEGNLLIIERDLATSQATDPVPLSTSSGQSIQFSADNSTGNVTVTIDSAEDLNTELIDIKTLSLAASEAVTDINPLSPKVEFTSSGFDEGEVARFAFEISDTTANAYLKVRPDGTVYVFNYEKDNLGVYTGARIEYVSIFEADPLYSPNAVRDGEILGEPPSDKINHYRMVMAVYVQEGGRGDDDGVANGVIVDPGTVVALSFASTTGTTGTTGNLPITVTGSVGGPVAQPTASTPKRVVTVPAQEKNFSYLGDEPLEVYANEEDNDIETGSGDDLIGLGKGNDTVSAGSGNDDVFAGQGNDFVGGNEGFDTIRGGQGQDTIGGGKGADQISGGLGADLIYGGLGHDRIDGDQGHDVMEGGRGSDTISGGAGFDHLQGVSSNNGRGASERDKLEGGDLADVFYLGDELGAYYLDLEDGMVGFAHIVDFAADDKLALMNTDGLRIVRNTNVNGIEGSGVAIFMQDDLVAFIQGDAAAINSIDLDDQSRVLRQRFADLAPAR